MQKKEAKYGLFSFHTGSLEIYRSSCSMLYIPKNVEPLGQEREKEKELKGFLKPQPESY